MKKIIVPRERTLIKEPINKQFKEWCMRNNLEVPDNPSELLNDGSLNASQKEYIWSVVYLLSILSYSWNLLFLAPQVRIILS